jgi:CO/xanthine dehydrogenase FAD-binding subunit
LQPFDYISPKDHAEASALLAQGTGVARAFMGGTDLLIRIRGGFVRPERVVDLKHLPGIRDIEQSPDEWLVIGAACTMNQVACHPTVQARYDLLAQACNSVASYQLRNRATLGGNICNASPAADTAPALYCLEAVAEIFGPHGSRRVPIAEFFRGPGKSVLRSGEFLTAIHLPPAPAQNAAAFNKLGRTKIGDISMVSVAVYGWTKDEGPMTKAALGPSSLVLRREWAIALGSVGPTPLRAPEAEASLAADTSPEGVRRAAELAAAAARPIDDIRASAAYRRAMVAVLARRGIESVLDKSSPFVLRPSSVAGSSSAGGAPSIGSGGAA